MAGDSQDPRFGYWEISRHGKNRDVLEVYKKVFVKVQSYFLALLSKDLR